MRQIILSFLILVGLYFASSSQVVAESQTAGQTTVVYLKAFADERQLEVNNMIKVGEVLTTRPDARLHARMVDNTVLMLGENAKFKIDELAFNDMQATASFSILSGAFRMVSGKLTKRPNNQVTLTTPIATIGIRGTDFWGIVKQDSLSIALLDDSEIVVLLPTGPVTLNNPMSLLEFKKGDQRPTLTPLSEEALTSAVKTIALPN
ncbi:FecR family protein [Curvivirga sp.]|uniref:FecR family protein n=1 Tax=Curvivirga sp. TaxID=2856848 RepID=UPI003B5AE53A